MSIRRLSHSWALTTALIGGCVQAAAAGEPPTGGPPEGGAPSRVLARMIDFTAIDANRDGRLTRPELRARAIHQLAEFDRDGDGALDRGELVAAMPGPRDRLTLVFAPDPAARRAEEFLAVMGATGAGRVTIGVLADRRVDALLERVDADGDGTITRAEADAIAPLGSPPRAEGGARGHESRETDG